MLTRIISGIALAVLALAAIMFLPLLALRLAAILVAVIAADEYLRLVSTQPRLPSLILVALVCWYVPLGGLSNILYLGLAVFAWLVIEVMWRGVSLQEASARFLAPWYIGLPMGMLAGVHAAGGRWVTLLLIGTIVVSDSAQYFTGRAFGRRPLAPVISPKKTVEGAIGGVLFGTLFVVFFELAGLNRDLTWRITLGMMIVMLGIIGDLFESKLKRSSGIKDSSSLIPGHGGVLDRIDALLFAAPAFYLYMR